MCPGYRCYTGELEPLSKYPHGVRRRKENAEAILYLPLHLPPDEPYHLRGAC